MKEQINNSVVQDVTTKKKYVKPDFEVIDLEDTPNLLAASGQIDGTFGTSFRTITRDENNW